MDNKIVDIPYEVNDYIKRFNLMPVSKDEFIDIGEKAMQELIDIANRFNKKTMGYVTFSGDAAHVREWLKRLRNN